MKLNQLGVSAALLTFASIAVGGLKAPANATPTGHTANSVDVAQAVGDRPGDVCRQVRIEGLELYAAPDQSSAVITAMLPSEQVNMIRNGFVGDDGNLYFELEDSVGNVGFMLASARMFPGGPLESTLAFCDGSGPMTFPVTW